jgi:phenylacetate-CoA ligase
MMFWDQKTETIDRAALEALQLKRLQATVRRVARKVPLYRQKLADGGVKPRMSSRWPMCAGCRSRPTPTCGTPIPPGCWPSGSTTRCGCTPPAAPPANPRRCSSRARDVDNAAELMARCLVMTGVTRDVFSRT